MLELGLLAGRTNTLPPDLLGSLPSSDYFNSNADAAIPVQTAPNAPPEAMADKPEI